MTIKFGGGELENIYLGNQEVKAVYKGSENIRPVGRQPGVNTLVYLPLESNANDQSGRTDITITTSSSNITYTTLGGIACATGNGSNSKISISPLGVVNTNDDTYGTYSILVYLRSIATSGNYTKAFEFAVQNKSQCLLGAGQMNYGLNQWLHVVRTGNKNTGKYRYYVNGVFKEEMSDANAPRGKRINSDQQGQYLFCNRGGDNNRMNGGIREFLMEKKEWTDAEIVAYYNWIMKKLGLVS